MQKYVGRRSRRHAQGCSIAAWTQEEETCLGYQSTADKIILPQWHFWGKHGANPGEQAQAQEFVINAEIFTDLRLAGKSDCLQDTLDYGRCYAGIKNILEEKHYALLEAIADDIATFLLSFARVLRVKVRVEKCRAVSSWGTFPAAVEILRLKR